MVANEKAENMQWVRLDGLSPWARNARQHSDDSTSKLAAGIRRFGFLVPLTAWRDESRIAAGHGRRLAMQAILREDPAFIPRNAPLGVGPGMVPVMWEDFATEAQFEAFALADNRQAKNAEDDAEAIAAILREMDEQGLDFDGMGFEHVQIEDLLDELEKVSDESDDEPKPVYGDELYTKTVNAPIYEPKMDKPPSLNDLFDNSKTASLCAQIDAADIPADVAGFLRVAAERHTALHFRNIAEFYCHASLEVQDLMERSGLVIIDFDKAIENGFVRLTGRLSTISDAERQEGASGSLLSQTKADTIDDIVKRASGLGYNAGRVKTAIKGWNPTGQMYDRWYRSIEAGDPDFSVYGEVDYAGEAFGCWWDYSRKYLRQIIKPNLLPPDGIIAALGSVSVVADLGCGLGLTTAALAEIFTEAEVVGTNVAGSIQYDIAESLGADYRFRLVETLREIPQSSRLTVFASEYFEHFQAPVEHLREVVETLQPTGLLVANTFTGKAIGHFPNYQIDGQSLGGLAAGRAFNNELRRLGYSSIKSKLWNDKPRLWIRNEG